MFLGFGGVFSLFFKAEFLFWRLLGKLELPFALAVAKIK